MTASREATRRTGTIENPYCADILSENGQGSWIVTLPPDLAAYQAELEALLGKVFSSRARLPENFALAQQMSLNWCMSKCRQVGISFEESLRRQPVEAKKV